MTRERLIGGPGCGKTTALLERVEAHLANGGKPEEIAFVSFTKKAAQEAIERAAVRFKLDRRRFAHFRTLHSLAYRGAGINQSDVMEAANYRELGQALGVALTGGQSQDGTDEQAEKGDHMLTFYNLARNTNRALREVWAEHDTDLTWQEVKRFADSLELYKKDMGKVDFNDMMDLYLTKGEPLDVKLAIIDEAQDLAPLHWAVAAHALGLAPHLLIAGDDDQAIHEWNGADVGTFLGFKGTHTELTKSHRLPRKIHALSRTIGDRIRNRIPKHTEPDDREGVVHYAPGIEALPLETGSWFILVRNTAFLRPVYQSLQSLGYPYESRSRGPLWSSVRPGHVQAIRAWEAIRKGDTATGADAAVMVNAINGKSPQLPDTVTQEDLGRLPYGLPWFEALKNIHPGARHYYRAILRRGEKLTAKPRIYVGTVHSVKGGEADHVAVLPDMTTKTAHAFEQHPDQEHRVFYVAVTRAREALYLLPPTARHWYEL